MQSPADQKRLKFVLRLLAAIGVGLAVSGISLYVGWQDTLKAKLMNREQWRTQYSLKEIKSATTDYEKEFGTSPKSFSDLQKMTNAFLNIEITSDRRPLDGWKRPFVFSQAGTNLIALSYGRDGQPGGKGLDFDLTTTNIYDAGANTTFHQFLYDMPTGGMIQSCFVCGGLAFLLALCTIKIPDVNRRSLLGFVVKLIATVIAASFVASIITALHIPSGH